jgi:acetylornithine deacetylase/succinyl-diaminopimelate desuccinylase-like protein
MSQPISTAETAATLSPVLERIDRDMEGALERLKALLAIPSISTDLDYDAETRRAAQWLADDLASIGFDASVRDTVSGGGHPLVVAHYRAGSSPRATAREANGDRLPHILYYGHYDVQPPDPLELWDSPPFVPQVVPSAHGQKIVARGAVDDKGQLMTFIEAFRAWKQTHGNLPINITVLLEGEEESGSPSLDPFLEANKDELKADVCVVCDTGMWDVNTPAITYMLRGLVYLEVKLIGPSCDLHSGMYGGAIVNPLNALTEILGQIHDDNGRVQFPGFYDDVKDLTQAERDEWNNLGFDEQAFLAGAGLQTPFGEQDYSTLERTWARPTCDINGIVGGYTGRGAKTVIGTHASAKLSCRLVAHQNPQKIYDSVVRFFEERTPPDCRWEFINHGRAPAIRVPTDSPYLNAARTGLAQIYQRDPVLIGSGGSIPLVGSVEKILGINSLLVGFGLDDDRVHSPNEKFELRCFTNGIKSHAAILAQFAGGQM